MRKTLAFLIIALFFCLALPNVLAASINVPATATAGDTVTFSFLDADTLGGEVSSYLWSFGDGETFNTTASSVTHVYSSSGSFTVSCVVAYTLDLGEDWEVSPEFGLTESFSDSIIITNNPTSTPTATSTNDQAQVNNVVSNMYTAVGLIGVCLIVLACGLIFTALNSGEADTKIILAGLIILIGSVAFLVIGFSIIVELEKSFNGLLTVLFLVH